jgi:hypothetical protein
LIVATYNGTGSDDVIYGGKGDDVIYGGIGNDSLYGEDGNDSIYGDEGNDSLYGGKGVDVIYGGKGNDSLYGEDGNDRIYGGEGNDSLYGGNGDDWLYGGKGDDYIDGGDGIDTAEYASNRNEYALENLYSGKGTLSGYRLTPLTPNASNDGVDEISTTVEWLRFADGSLRLSDKSFTPVAPLPVASVLSHLHLQVMEPVCRDGATPGQSLRRFRFYVEWNSDSGAIGSYQ